MTQNAAIVGDLTKSLAQAGPARRDTMLVKIADLFEGVSHLLDGKGVDTFDSIFVSLIPTCSVSAKVHLADKIAANPKAPAKAIRHLAFDDAIVVARPVIRLSPLLLDDHLMALALVKGPDHLMAICERAALSPGITDVILSRANGELMIALVNNDGARFSSAGKTRLANAALDDGSLYDRVIIREDISAELVALESDEPLPTVAVAATPVTTGDPQEMRDVDQQVSALLAGDKVDVALGLVAKQVTVPTSAVAKAFALDIHGGFLAYAKAVPLSWDTTLRFLMKRYEAGQVTPRLQRAELDFKKLAVADARRVAALLGQHAAKPN
ncbi:MAG: DUF2336 domain-containing protein [Bosea sp. (in: a-proteobacteria)]